jgi:hypothetical protein
MQQYLDSPRCRLIPLSGFLDSGRQSCVSETTCCDRCNELGLLAGGEEVDKYVEAEGVGRQQQQQQQQEEEDKAVEEARLGGKLLEQRTSTLARQLEYYQDRLNLLRGSCPICRLLGPVGSGGYWHTLDDCRSNSKRRFFQAKKEAIQAGKKRGGWLAEYGACFRCGNIQAACEQQGRDGCRHKDLIIPLCWALYYNLDWGDGLLQRISRGRRFSRESEYMLWLGEVATLYGQQATNLAVVADKIAEIMIQA